MVDQQLVVKENIVTIMLVTTVGVDLPGYLRTWEGTDLDHESSLSGIGSFLLTAEIPIGLDMPENGFRAVENVGALLEFKVFEQHFKLIFGFLDETFHIS